MSRMQILTLCCIPAENSEGIQGYAQVLEVRCTTMVPHPVQALHRSRVASLLRRLERAAFPGRYAPNLGIEALKST